MTEGSTTITASDEGWQRATIDFGPTADVNLDDGVLLLTITAEGGSTSEVLVAFDTTDYPSALTTVRTKVDLAGSSSSLSTALQGR